MPVDPARLNPVGDLVLTGADELRALADPLRLMLFDLVCREGPSTSDALAAKADEEPASVDAHLRALASIGLIEQDTDARWTRRRPGDLLRGSRGGRSPACGARAQQRDAGQVRITSDELRALREDLERLLEPFTNRPDGERPGGAAPVRIMAYFMPEATA